MKTKNYRLTLPCYFFFISYTAFSQVLFQKYHYIRGYYDVQQTSDSGYILTGIGGSPSGTTLCKLNNSGDTVWTKKYSGTFCPYLQKTMDSGYALSGGINDVYLIKTNSFGDTLWTKMYGGTGQDYGNSFQQTSDSGFILAGSTDSYGAGLKDIYIIKTNAIGDTLWTKVLGGINSEEAKSVKQTSDGGFIVAGYSSGFGAGGKDIIVVRLDANGGVLWSKTFGGVNDDEANSIIETSGGGFLFGGFTASPPGVFYNCSYVIKTNGAGDTLWTRTFGDSSVKICSISKTQSNGFILAAEAQLALALINLNNNGDTLWTRQYGDQMRWNSPLAVQTTFDGGFIVSGFSDHFPSGLPPTPRAYLIRTDSTGFVGCFERSQFFGVGFFQATVAMAGVQITSSSNVSQPSFPVTNSPFFINNLCSSVTGINNGEANNNQIQVFPNPAAGFLTIALEGNLLTDAMITVSDLSGREFYQSNEPVANGKLDLTVLPGGMYILKIIHNGSTTLKRIILTGTQ